MGISRSHRLLIRGSDLLQDWDCHIVVPLAHALCQAHAPWTLSHVTHVGSWGLLPSWPTLTAGPILPALTSEFSWTQSDYSFWHKHSSSQERTSLPRAQPRSTPSSLWIGTSLEALSSLVSPPNPGKKDRPGWVHLNWREVTYPPPTSNLHSGWGRHLTFHCLLCWLFCIHYLIKSSE